MLPGPIIGDFNLDHLVKVISIRFIPYKDFFFFNSLVISNL